MIEGALVKMGGKDWTVPALTFKQVRTLLPKLTTIPANAVVLTPEQMEVVTEVIHAAVSRNYPEITPDDIDDMLDLRNVQTILLAVMGQSGLEPSAPGE